MNEIISGIERELFTIKTPTLIPKASEVEVKIREKINQIPKEEAERLRDSLIEGISDCIKNGKYSCESEFVQAELTDEIKEVIQEFEENGYKVEFSELAKLKPFLKKPIKRIILTIPN